MGASQSGERARSRSRRSFRVYRAEFALGAALVLYAVLAYLAGRYAYFQWDIDLARLIQSIRWPGFHTTMVGVSWLGTDWAPVVMVSLTGLILILKKRKWEGIICMAGTGLGALCNRLLKMWIARPRPDDSLVTVLIPYPNESFPSGHVVLFVQFFGFLMFLGYVLTQRAWLQLLLAVVPGFLIITVGISRVYLGAHWPSDVAGAYLAGGIWLFLMMDFYRRRTRQKGPPGDSCHS